MPAAATPERPRAGVVPFLAIRDGRGRDAVAFYQAAFLAEVTETNPAQDGRRLMQAGLKLNGGWMMLADVFPEMGGPAGAPPSAVTLHLPVDDVDAWWARALAAGAEVIYPLADQFWGDRYGQIRDPFGHTWSLASPVRPSGGPAAA